MSESEVPPAYPNGSAPEVIPGTPTKPTKARAPKKAKPVHTPSADGELITLKSKADYERMQLPEDEADPYWDPALATALKDLVPKDLIEQVKAHGFDKSKPITAHATEDGKLHIVDGRTRWRVVQEAVKAGKSPEVTVWVEPAVDGDVATVDMLLRAVRLNHHVRTKNPMETAENIVRLLSADADEKAVAHAYGITTEDLHGYLLLTDERMCPPKVQELLRNGQISFSAALELARRAEKLTPGEVAKAAEQIAKVSEGGLKVTASHVKAAAGVQEDKPASRREKCQAILNLQSAKFAGKHGEAVRYALIAALEVGLGTRTLDSMWEVGDKLSKGATIKIDFKEYQKSVDKKESDTK